MAVLTLTWQVARLLYEDHFKQLMPANISYGAAAEAVLNEIGIKNLIHRVDDIEEQIAYVQANDIRVCEEIMDYGSNWSIVYFKTHRRIWSEKLWDDELIQRYIKLGAKIEYGYCDWRLDS